MDEIMTISLFHLFTTKKDVLDNHDCSMMKESEEGSPAPVFKNGILPPPKDNIKTIKNILLQLWDF